MNARLIGNAATRRPQLRRDRARDVVRDSSADDTPAINDTPRPWPPDIDEDLIDQALDLTFPASDPPAWSINRSRSPSAAFTRGGPMKDDRLCVCAETRACHLLSASELRDWIATTDERR
jgi:hypothetical protein